MAANDQLWDEERSSRKRLAKRSFFLVIIVGAIIACLCGWITQPLIGRREKMQGVNVANPERLKEHVTKLSQEFYPRNHQNLINLNLTADYIRKEFEKTGGKVSEQTFVINGATYRNIVLNLGEGDELIVIGAHYDAAIGTPGADDNASGVAGLVELAALLSKEQHSTPIELVAYSLEEPPFFGTSQMGSSYHAKSLADENVRVRMMICLEMIGYYSDEPNTQKFPLILGQLLYPTTGNFTAIVGNFTNISNVRRVKYSMNSVDGPKVYSLNAPTFVGGIDLSDHRNYWNLGYDAVMITDTAFYRNQTYHTAGDTADRLDYSRMAKVVDAINVAVLDLAE